VGFRSAALGFPWEILVFRESRVSQLAYFFFASCNARTQLVACNRGIAAWKTRQAVKALIRTFAPKQTS